MTMPWTDLPCYLNGHLGRLGDAKVPVMDRGFLFGDGVYEAIPVYGRRLFRVEAHLDRLSHSLRSLRIEDPYEREAWLDLFHSLVAHLPEVEDQTIYLQVTRGVAPRDHAMPRDIEPTVLAYTQPLVAISAEKRHQGLACVTARDFRWQRGDIKSTSLLGNVLARQMSADQGADETLLIRDGFLTEGSASNVWVVRDGALLTPPPGELLLEGVRVGLLREFCEELGIACNLRPIAETELTTADEILLTSASKEVAAVTRLDHEPVGHGALRGKPGPVYSKLYEAYQRAKLLQGR
ncbi:MAG: D-amino acid aminotransferase [Mitsuaria chitosanitabida]|uniref:D-amino acid aminotransferase n=1 Tax=Roseateles chitosanitabidus TaxID=65048 RepID=UPI001B25E08C|nr:D-amino acid aminotransferase [Roseateles chitosanitabidus]MBO9686814.1 D-amino acid aminotransferase [Roseateles chitosanitabidus]